MSSVDAALAAMDTAEQEARDLEFMPIETPNDELVIDLMRDRLRLIKRDRATLQRHAAWQCGHTTCPDRCQGCDNVGWPCPDARAVINHWTEEDA